MMAVKAKPITTFMSDDDDDSDVEGVLAECRKKGSQRELKVITGEVCPHLDPMIDLESEAVEALAHGVRDWTGEEVYTDLLERRVFTCTSIEEVLNLVSDAAAPPKCNINRTACYIYPDSDDDEDPPAIEPPKPTPEVKEEENLITTYVVRMKNRFASKGHKYEGNILEGQAHGHGVLTYRTGTKYKGGFAYSRPHGDGVCERPNGKRKCSCITI